MRRRKIVHDRYEQKIQEYVPTHPDPPKRDNDFRLEAKIKGIKERDVWKAPSPESKGKGVCTKCGNYIGRGIYFHQKNCKGHVR